MISREEQLQARLDEANKAWRRYQDAAAELQRLDRYKAKNKGMREDANRHFNVMLEAGSTLSRVLGKQP